MHKEHRLSQLAWHSPVASRDMLLLSLDRVPLLDWYTSTAGLHDRLTSGLGWLVGAVALTSALLVLIGSTTLGEAAGACMPELLSASSLFQTCYIRTKTVHYSCCTAQLVRNIHTSTGPGRHNKVARLVDKVIQAARPSHPLLDAELSGQQAMPTLSIQMVHSRSGKADLKTWQPLP